MQNLELIKQTITKYVLVNGALPEFKIKDPTIAGYVEKLFTFNPTKDATMSPEDYINEAINSYSGNIEIISEHIFSYLDKLAELLAGRINTSCSEINDVRVQVSQLEDNYYKSFDRMIASDPFMVSNYEHEREADPEHGLSTIDWSEISMIGSVMDIVAFANDMTNASSDEPAMKFLPILSGKISKTEVHQSPPIKLEKEYADNIIHVVMDNIDATYANVETVLTTLLTPTRVETFIMKWSTNIAVSEKRSENVTNMTNMIRIYKPIMDELLNHMDILGSAASRLIEDNAESISQVLYGCAYTLLVMRDQIFTETLIMQNKTINMDNYEPFIAEGNKDSAILQHLFVKYSNDKMLPEFGVSRTAVETNAERVASIYSSSLDDVASKVVFTAKKYKTMAFNETMRTWAVVCDKDMNGETIPSHTINLYIDSARAQLNSEAPLNTIFTNMVFNTTAPKSFGFELYKRLDHEFVNYLSNVDCKDETIINRINGTVMADIVIDFLKDIAISTEK